MRTKAWNEVGGSCPIPLPDWLTAGPAPIYSPSPETKSRQFAEYEIVLPRILEVICAGSTLSSALRELPIKIDEGSFFRWLKKKPKYYELYLEAKEIRTECWAGRLIEHAESKDVAEEVSRSRLIVDTYKWLMGADNRKTYGDTKSIEISSTISITAALANANTRILSIDNLDDPDVIDVDLLDEIPNQQIQLMLESDEMD